jgi:quercetin dioxygenase-like cupin family protein
MHVKELRGVLPEPSLKEASMSQVIRELATHLPIPDAGIASSPLLDLAGSTKLVLFALDAGQEISPHSTPFPAQVLVLGGKLEVMVGGDWETLGASDGLDLPPGIPHALRALAPSHFLLTMLRGVKAEPAAEPLPERDEALRR